MLVDLLCTDNYMNYNIKVAHVLGLNAAIYISAILKVQNLSSNNGEPYMISRKDISDFTCLTRDIQLLVEADLQKIDLLTVEPIDDMSAKVYFKVDNFTKIFVSGDENYYGKLNKIVSSKEPSKTKGMSARQKQFYDLKSKIYCDSPELLAAYQDWVDGVYANPKGFLSVRSINIFQKTVNEFAQGDLELALKIIDIATVNGYRDATWAINLFNKDYAQTWKQEHKKSQPIVTRKAHLSTEVF